MKRVQLAQDSEANMLFVAIQMAKKDALPANYVKRFVQLKPSPLRQKKEMTEAEELPNTISTC